MVKNILKYLTLCFLRITHTKKCKHMNKKEIWRDHPDAYIEYECLDCGERIFIDMYNK